MKLQKISLAETRSFSPSFLAYIEPAPQLQKFYNRFPEIKNFKDQIKEKSESFPQANREVLVQVLQKQYEKYTITESVKKNIELLGNKKTFTITTGHQLNIFTGPLYFIFKIVTVINACKKLKEIYPDYNFVPVYWMASEDHDFDEIKYFKLQGKKYTWNSNQKGAVGRFNPKELESLLKEVPGDITLFREAYLKHSTLGDAVRYYVNKLFGSEGLGVVDGDSRALKTLFKHVIHDDLESNSSKKLVDATNVELEKLGYKPQVFCREVNFFYLEDGLRERIEKSGDRYTVVDSAISFSGAELKSNIENSPEKFSPNVILRPLYQEVILPNLAYVGGPAEVVYWLQLKEVFKHYKTPFPILMPRNFAMVMDAPTKRKFEKTGLELNELFMEKDQLFNHYASKFAQNKIKLNGEKEAIEIYFQTIRKQAEEIDKTLGPLVGAETQRAIKSLEKIESKLLRAEKRFQSDKLTQVGTVKDSLFPNGGLQERSDNFLNFYLQDPKFIEKLIQHFDPFDFRFNVLMYHD
ncbi:MAG TPA: bacillithiol biosynthesis cysteine-adding enzyme BshC [Cyclobacteriaceae bacterium]|nr:bacillithiol biosynthesis cysteine-adding enzyme BshC [Cyclobacteriaceae bacterium]